MTVVRISRKRKHELMCEALCYAGQLLRQVVVSYQAFENLPPHEREFMDEYIVSIGDRLFWQGEAKRDVKSKAAAQHLLRALDGKGQ